MVCSRVLELITFQMVVPCANIRPLSFYYPLSAPTFISLFVSKNQKVPETRSVSKIHFNLAEICCHNIVYSFDLSSFSSSSLRSGNTTVQSRSCELFYIKAQDNSRHGGVGVGGGAHGTPLGKGRGQKRGGRWRWRDEGGLDGGDVL